MLLLKDFTATFKEKNICNLKTLPLTRFITVQILLYPVESLYDVSFFNTINILVFLKIMLYVIYYSFSFKLNFLFITNIVMYFIFITTMYNIISNQNLSY